MYNFPDAPTNGQTYQGYTWNGEAWIGGNAAGAYVPISGGTMTGHLFLPTNPAAANAVRKDYVDAVAGNYLPLSGGTVSGDVTLYRSASPATGALFLGNTGQRWLFWDGSAYSLGGAGTIWHSGNFNPASYLPLGGGTMSGQLTIANTSPQITFYDTDWGNRYLHCNGGTIGFLSNAYGWTHQFYDNGSANFAANLVIGGATYSTDGNVYMTWAGDWLSNVLGGKYPTSGGTVNGTVWATSEVRANGLFWGIGSGAQTTTNAANTYINPAGNMHRSTSSDRFKTAIEPLEDLWADKVMQLEPIYYRPVDTSADPVGYTRYGFAAEQCYAVDPRFSTCEPQTYKGMDDDGKPIYEDKVDVIGLDLNAIVAALQQVIKRQEARIAALEAAA